MKKNDYECDLKSCLLCRLCLKDWLPAIAVHKKNIFIKKGQPIFREGVDQWRHFEAWLDPLKIALGPVLDAYPFVPEF